MRSQRERPKRSGSGVRMARPPMEVATPLPPRNLIKMENEWPMRAETRAMREK